MARQTAGYSGRPLHQKLGFKPGMTCAVIRGPDHYADLLDGADGVHFVHVDAAADIGEPVHAVHLFCRDRADLDREGARALQAIAEKGMLWVSWPKKSSPMFVDLTEDGIRSVLLPTGWVDVKVAAVDQDWSGLKIVRRVKK